MWFLQSLFQNVLPCELREEHPLAFWLINRAVISQIFKKYSLQFFDAVNVFAKLKCKPRYGFFIISKKLENLYRLFMKLYFIIVW